ncbi:MAG: hypothetical protein QF491_08175, partial [Alphaproteobacteria bacterium]|nr:hypothetical protein [Alphaproteobacteria bacterium]
MSLEHVDLVAFHLTGERSGGQLQDVSELDLRPALFSGYGDLSRLRYDYPLVLVAAMEGEELLRPLSGIIDDLLAQIAAPGSDGEFDRKQLLNLEHEIRAALADGEGGTLSEAWRRAAEALRAEADEAAEEQLADLLERAKAALPVDGELIDCDGEAPGKVLRHAWQADQKTRAGALRRRLDQLILKLHGILQADYLKSADAKTADNLKGSVGTSYEATFDFEALSRLLPQGAAEDALPETRRQRVQWALDTLRTQRFVTGGQQSGDEAPYDFVFDGCAGALAAFRERLPGLVDLIKALAIAELEIDNRYKESRHDAYFARFNENTLVAADLEPFPSYLVLLRGLDRDPGWQAEIIQAMSTGLPIKVLAQADDILRQDDDTPGQFSFGAKGLQIANMALGLNRAYVLQAGASNLCRFRDKLQQGLAYPGPALFSVFSGAAGNAAGAAPYLAAASAMESRAFPAFTYDPSAGNDWASRFCIADNPQAESEWPEHDFHYEDAELQRIEERLTFTFVDFVACDRRFADHLAGLPSNDIQNGLLPVGEYLRRTPEDRAENVPYLLMVDRDDRLRKVVVDETLIGAARRCGEVWHALQELGGIHNSHADRLLAAERDRWQEEKERELAELRDQAPAGPAVSPAPATATEAPAATPAAEDSAEAAAEVEAAPPSDDAYIETPRCTTCNECTELNNRLFAYDENEQAYIADP